MKDLPLAHFHQKIKHTSLSQRIQDLLRDQIINQEIKPGTRLVEEEIAKELGVSRTPVREALNALSQRGLVESRPRRGMYTIQFTKEYLSEIYEIRTVLEGLAAAQATSQMPEEALKNLDQLHQSAKEALTMGNLERCIELDTDLHDAMISYSPNSRLVALLESIHDQILIFRTWESMNASHVKISLEEHRGIIEALISQDADLARIRMEEHVERVRLGLLEEYPFDQNEERKKSGKGVIEVR